MSGKGKMIAVVTTLCVGMCFTAVPLASADTFPGPVGALGGNRPDPTGGSVASQSLTTDGSERIGRLHGAGTVETEPDDVAIRGGQTVRATLHGGGFGTKMGSYTKVSCMVNAAKSELGSGSAKNGAKCSGFTSQNTGGSTCAPTTQGGLARGQVHLRAETRQEVDLDLKGRFGGIDSSVGRGDG